MPRNFEILQNPPEGLLGDPNDPSKPGTLYTIDLLTYVPTGDPTLRRMAVDRADRLKRGLCTIRDAKDLLFKIVTLEATSELANAANSRAVTLAEDYLVARLGGTETAEKFSWWPKTTVPVFDADEALLLELEGRLVVAPSTPLDPVDDAASNVVPLHPTPAGT